ncbi:pinensin family lanthipeptide [Roseivirga sp. BDSF3-8]|uniref:pinensin family lanthipeptide n=1 Tax=Roseivirga sp. BDSF3-8 TaxID=3241598 RepID=UPI003531FE2D
MKKEKMKLEELEVESFTTSLKNEIRAGAEASDGDYTTLTVTTVTTSGSTPWTTVTIVTTVTLLPEDQMA